MKKGDCLKKKGKFFKDKKAAATWCDAQTTGWCCLDGKVLSMKKGDCLKKKGHFFKGKKEAATYCDLHQTGYCCLNGKIRKMLKGDCLKKKGKFFKDKKAAATWCDAQITGWCCLDGKVLSMIKGDCLEKKGRFFKDKAAAAKACEARKKGWCCKNGTVKSLTRQECKRIRGTFFAKKQEALHYLRVTGKKKMAATRPGARKDIHRKGAPKGGPSFGTKGVSGGSVSDRLWRFPARITDVSHPITPGDRIAITGIDFGHRRGRVIINYRTIAAPVILRIISWSETSIEAEVPRYLANHIHSEPIAATLCVYPARVSDTRPLSTEGEGALEDYQGYHYNGEEGPSYPIRIEPITPEITSFASTEVAEGDYLDIYGRNFGSEGTLTLLNGSRSVPFTLDHWRSTHIRVNIPINALESSGNPERATIDVRVENEYRNETIAENAVTITRVDRYDLELVGIRVSNYRTERHRRKVTTYFDVSPIIRNNGPDRCERRIHIEMRPNEFTGTGTLHQFFDITSTIAAGSEAEAPSRSVELTESHHGIIVGIAGIPGLHHDDPNNDACHFNVTRNGVYHCERP